MTPSSPKWLDKFIKKRAASDVAVVQPVNKINLHPQTGPAYKLGDYIGQEYVILDVIGKGGFGIVYVVYSEKHKSFYVFKTLQEKFLADREVRNRFTKEAKIWVALGRHPYLVHADFVQDIAGRIYIGMEYIPPNEQGVNTLQGYLDRQPFDLAQSLRWAIQICMGMEYAYSRGLRAHRDIKPANIMITPQGNIKITDFGLSGILSAGSTTVLAGSLPATERMTFIGAGFGTPTHMAPEQFQNAADCDERSDIYSFGVLLYQLAASGHLPFNAPFDQNYWPQMQRLHQHAPLPVLDSPFYPLIQRCLEKKPENRCQSFSEAHQELQTLLTALTGERVVPDEQSEDRVWEWVNKAYSYSNLGDYALALESCEKALQLDSHQAGAWLIKGGMLYQLGRYAESIHCFDIVLNLNPKDVSALSNKSASLLNLGKVQEAMNCIDAAIAIEPENAMLKYNKCRIYETLNQCENALSLIEEALMLDPQHVNSWILKGNCLGRLNRPQEAIEQYSHALSLDPLQVDAWLNIGRSLLSQSSFVEALRVFDKVLEIDRRNVTAWTNKGSCLDHLTKNEEAIRCYEMALQIDPKSELTWIAKAMSEDQAGNLRAALHSYQQFLACSSGQYASLVDWANERSRELMRS